MNEIIGVVIAVIGGIIHSRLQKNRLAVEIHMQWWIPLWTDILLPIVMWILYFLSRRANGDAVPKAELPQGIGPEVRA